MAIIRTSETHSVSKDPGTSVKDEGTSEGKGNGWRSRVRALLYKRRQRCGKPIPDLERRSFEQQVNNNNGFPGSEGTFALSGSTWNALTPSCANLKRVSTGLALGSADLFHEPGRLAVKFGTSE